MRFRFSQWNVCSALFTYRKCHEKDKMLDLIPLTMQDSWLRPDLVAKRSATVFTTSKVTRPEADENVEIILFPQTYLDFARKSWFLFLNWYGSSQRYYSTNKI